MDKTQVFPLDASDFVRTRLTHSMEVASVARGLTSLAIELVGNEAMIGRREDLKTIAAAAGLVHDLGNPPFGHFGEAAIQSWFKTPQGREALGPLRDDGHEHLLADLTSFEGNARTIRLIASLQVLADRWGLNPTAATLSTCMKYVAASREADRNDSNHAFHKPGYCQTEAPVVAKVREATGTGDSRHPLAFIVEAADDCVYSFCDLEDGLKKRTIEWPYLKHLFELRGLGDAIEGAEEYIDSKLAESGLELDQATKHDAYATQLRIHCQGEAINAAASAFRANYREIMGGTFGGELLPEDSGAEGLGVRLVTAAKEIGREHVYRTRSTVELELRGVRVIHDLLDVFWDGASGFVDGSPPKPGSYAGKCWQLISVNYRNVFEHSWRTASESDDVPVDVWRSYLKLMLITDYVAGMTDGFATSLHRNITNG